MKPSPTLSLAPNTFEESQFEAERTLNAEAYRLGMDYAKYNLTAYKGIHKEFERGAKENRVGKGSKLGLFQRKLLYLRMNALKRRLIVSPSVTPEYLRSILTKKCPVSLKPFILKGEDVNWSVDRIINDGAYAEKNLIFLNTEVNNAKSDLDFPVVLELARKGQDHGKLKAIEWARLASVMYGAYQKAHPGAVNSDVIFPLCTDIPKHCRRALCHEMQDLLLKFVVLGSVTLTETLWRDVTIHRTGRPTLFDDALSAIRRNITELEYPYDVWLIPNVYSAFKEWWYRMVLDIFGLKMTSVLANPDEEDKLNHAVESWCIALNGKYSA